MGLFNIAKKEAKPVLKYSQIEQGTKEPVVPVPPPMASAETYLLKIDQVLANQATIVDNQQFILNSIVGTQDLIRSLATTEEATEAVVEEVEPTQEEWDAALAEIKRKKALPEKHRGMPKGGWPKKK